MSDFDVLTGELIIFTFGEWEDYAIEFAALALMTFNFEEVELKYKKHVAEKQESMSFVSFKQWLFDKCICTPIKHHEWHGIRELP